MVVATGLIVNVVIIIIYYSVRLNVSNPQMHCQSHLFILFPYGILHCTLLMINCKRACYGLWSVNLCARLIHLKVTVDFEQSFIKLNFSRCSCDLFLTGVYVHVADLVRTWLEIKQKACDHYQTIPFHTQ